MIKKPEILAPAGSYDSLKSAVYFGADAVYLGGSMFGARAFAGNFEEEELIEGIKYAHLYGVKVYLTVNTLFRNEEIKELYSFIKPYYEAGLDAVIVQDLGVMEYIYRNFPGLAIHASTQMSITTPYAYELLKNYGVTRIVPARELSVEEIKKLKDFDYGKGFSAPELEVFVQGALCICYSGHCLMSSFIGGRSGNRGRCAQSCRLPYTLQDADGNDIKTEGEYLLSPKDLCGLDAVPALIKAGVDSFKIEGRMKKPEYVAACVSAYRRCVDYIFDKADNNLDIDSIIDNIGADEEYNRLVSDGRDSMAFVFNRGGFTKGYYFNKNGRDMMSFKAPGHMGVFAGKITGINKNRINLKLDTDIHTGDILIIRSVLPEITLTCNINAKAGDNITLNAPRSKELMPGMKLYKMFDKCLDDKLSAYKNSIRKIPVVGKAVFNKNKPAAIQLSIDNTISNRYGLMDNFTVNVFGADVMQAQSKPVSRDILYDKLNQTGDSVFYFSRLTIELDDDIFYPVKAIKQLRRDAFSILENEIVKSYTRNADSKSAVDDNITVNSQINDEETIIDSRHKNIKSRLHFVLSSVNQLKAIRAFENESFDISVDLQYFNKQDIMNIIKNNPDAGIVLPMIFKGRMLEETESISLDSIPMITVRNIDELAYLVYKDYKGLVITDYSLYTMNDYAIHFIRSHFFDAVITLPVELNKNQLENIADNNDKCELIVYNYQPLMVSAQCMMNNFLSCKRSDGFFYLKDRTGRSFYIRSICKYCYNIILNGVPTILFDIIKGSSLDNIRKRIQFTIEDDDIIDDVLDEYFNGSGEKASLSKSYEITRGHYKRGVL